MRLMTGNGRLARQLDELPAQFFYIMNLEDPEYMKDVFDGNEMWETFHEADPRAIKETLADMQKKRRSPQGINKKLIRDKDYLEKAAVYFFGDQSSEVGDVA